MLALPSFDLARAGDPRGLGVLTDARYLFELKLDGVRMIGDVHDARIRLRYRRGREVTASYPDVRDALAALGPGRLVVDGEVVVFGDDGRPSFDLVARRFQSLPEDAARLVARVPATYVLFDVLAVGPYRLDALAIEARKSVLEVLLGSAAGALRLHPTFDDGASLFAFCEASGLEGVIAKRRGSTYRWGERTSDWVKVKTELEGDFVVVGWTEGEGDRARLGALDLAALVEGRLTTCGSVGSGIGERALEELRRALDPLEVPRPPSPGRHSVKPTRRHWVRPEVVVSVRYASVTREGSLRHPVFRGIRPDAVVDDCVLARPAPVARGREPSAGDDVHSYYRTMSEALLPWLRAHRCTPLVLAPTGALEALDVGEGIDAPIADADELLGWITRGAVSFRMGARRLDAPDQVAFAALELRGDGALELLARWRALASRLGLPLLATASSPRSIDLLFGVRGAAGPAEHLGALLEQLVAGDGVSVRRVDGVVVPYALTFEAGAPRIAWPIDAASRIEERALDAAPPTAAAQPFAAPIPLEELTARLGRVLGGASG